MDPLLKITEIMVLFRALLCQIQTIISNTFVIISKNEENVPSPVTPVTIRSYSKAFRRTTKQMVRKPGKSRILTSFAKKNRVKGKLGKKQQKKR